MMNMESKVFKMEVHLAGLEALVIFSASLEVEVQVVNQLDRERLNLSLLKLKSLSMKFITAV